MSRRIFGSLTRISDLADTPYEVEFVDMAHWSTGDYVEAVVVEPVTDLCQVEEADGRINPVMPGDIVVGAFGHRAATLEGAGSWMDVRDGDLEALTSAGLFGKFTSVSRFIPTPMSLTYRGHVLRNDRKVRMQDFARQSDYPRFDIPTILLVGTSMSAGKTVAGKAACSELAYMGYGTTGAKLTGAGRYRDILGFRDSGASQIYDFVDAGMPSTIVPEDEYRAQIRPLLRHIASERPDFLVCEAGASPLEPYNGLAAIEELGDSIVCRILCASDPYAVVGVREAFGFEPDLVTGPAANTSAATALVRKLTGLPSINLIDPDKLPEFRAFLIAQLGLEQHH